MHKTLTDTHGRMVSYMRISVTDRCNLRCKYCAGEALDFIPHPRILRYEEIMDLIGLGHSMGVDKIRFTGGEPFVRKGFADFMVAAAGRFPNMEMCVTTNATLIRDWIKPLSNAGIHRINISLDTLSPEKYEAITGRDMFSTVMENILRCVDAGMTVKVNAVAMHGTNDDELPGFLDFAASNALDFRLIEFMPVGSEPGWSDQAVWKASEILEQAQSLVDLTPSEDNGIRVKGPARMYDIRDGKGRFGIISPYTDHFCGTCNRLRITSDGKLRTCLFSDKTFRLRPALRHPALGLKFVERIIRRAGRKKPIGHELLERMPSGQSVCSTRMASIGG